MALATPFSEAESLKVSKNLWGLFILDVFWTPDPYNELVNEQPAPPQHLFVVRLWSEAGNTAQAPCRGSVEYVPTGQKFYFTSINDLTDFIALKATIQLTPHTEKEGAAG
jgi:hypothetical protein